MASAFPTAYFLRKLRGKFLKPVILLTISLLLMNMYFLGKKASWYPKIMLNRTDEQVKRNENGVIEKDVQMFQTILLHKDGPSREKKTLNTVRINLTLESWNGDDYGICTPHKPSEYSFEVAKRMYSIVPGLSHCRKKGMGEVCRMEVNDSRKGRTIYFACNKTLCEQGQNDSFKVHSLNPETGEIEIVKEFPTVEKLEKGLAAIATRNKENKFNYMFIECRNYGGGKVSQFLPIDPRFTVEKQKNARDSNVINVNVLLIDSLSRAHFYRSLPRTVATLRKWRENARAVPAKVFDFELFQAVHGHTVVNMQAFYTGELLPVEKKDETLPVNISALFGHYKKVGFHTVWQEDLCWKGSWGLMTDLGAHGWDDLQEKTKVAYIDHTGLTHSSCKILKSVGVNSPFNGPQGDQICYNGKFQHSYYLRYITDTLQAINASRKARPLLLFSALNVAHDHRSIRTQTLDVDLEGYVTTVAKDENTLSIILADHGNTYTSYTTQVLEGRFEMFHPSLFVIVPDKVASLLGMEAMSALETNKKRLVTMIDLHHSLMALSVPIHGVWPVGVFTPIPKNRTCDDLELRTPNLCVCEGWDIPADNNTSYEAIAEFAIGQLNNRLQEQYEKMLSTQNNSQLKPEKFKRSCQRLQPLWFENVRLRNCKVDGLLITSMDIRVTAGDQVPQKEDIFHIEVKTKEITGKNSLEMKLLTFDRLTLFGKYQACADNDVELKLCVCSRNASRTRSGLSSESPDGWKYFGQRSVLKRISNISCLFLAIRRHSKSDAFEVGNFCSDKSYRVKVGAVASNMKFSSELPLTMEVNSGRINFAFSAGKHLNDFETRILVSAKAYNETGVTDT